MPTTATLPTSSVRRVRTWAARLTYREPSLEALHRLASHGALDHRAPVQAVAEERINAPRDVVWQVLSDLKAWPSLDIGVSAMTAPTTLVSGQAFRWTNAGLPITSRLAVVEPGREISWTGVTYGIKAVHRQLLQDADHGATMLRSEESMAAPMLSLLYPSAKLQCDLDTFIAGIRRAAEAAAARN